MLQKVTVTYLDYDGGEADSEGAADRPYDLREAASPCPELTRFL